MATNFGFMPVLTGKRYFISYKSENTVRIGQICRKLNEMGVPMWYDYGIEKGKRWSVEINRNIEECEAFILFATKALFAAEDTWARKEFRLANMSHKKKYVVWLDEINPYNNSNDVHRGLKDWYLDVDELQGIKMSGNSVEQIAWNMVTEFHLIHGMTSQPPSPAFNSSAANAEAIPTYQSFSTLPNQSSPTFTPVQQPQQTGYQFPMNKTLSSAPANYYENPIRYQESNGISSSLKYTLMIAIAAIVLLVAMLSISSIWAISNSTSNRSDDLTSDSISDSIDNSTQNVKSLSELVYQHIEI